MTKTFTFAILHFTVAFLVAYLLTGSFVIGGLLALIEPACNTVVFYFHERAWQMVEQKKTASSVTAAFSAMPCAGIH
ncbi:MAG: DUF2061 domain-containing protein [Methylotenera sp.]|nr:DUF2061 domain-containing protein [Methylotenera sp.]HPH08611.1 DUF2061 domain-containing protein [Methylotenera sp.]HPM50102.1 DUF2061 domain-containing protein [Methylotenera sp.]HQM87284.1 DUF2061 domain-containing protein [Methylotenera sp.]